MRLFRVLAPLAGVLALASPQGVRAQDIRDANVLPRGVGALVISPSFSTGLERFGPAGLTFGRENLLSDINDIDLGRIIAGDNLDALELLAGGSLGITHFDGEQNSFGFDIIAAYGVTDRFTLVGLVAYSRADYRLDAWLSTPEGKEPASARVLDAVDIQCPGGEFQVEDRSDLETILDTSDPSYQFNVGDLRRVISSDCLGYEDPFNQGVSRGSDGLLHARGEGSYSGFRDSALGGKYKLYHTEKLGIAALGYVLFPTGAPDDPDDLFDPNFGDGQWDAALLVAGTYHVTPELSASLTTGYEISFGDTLVRRLFGLRFSEELETQLAEGTLSEQELYDQHLDDGDLVPLVTAYDKALVQRKLGDTVYLYLGLAYQITDYLGVGLNVDYLYHRRDAITDTGTHVEDGTRYPTESQIREEVDQLIASGDVLPEDKISELRARLAESSGRKAAAYAWHTIRQQMLLRLGVSFNTISWFLDGEFPIPFFFSVGATYNLAGLNIDANDSVGVSLGIPFVTTTDIKDPKEHGYDDVEGQGLPWP
jgi:hypothetical protein